MAISREEQLRNNRRFSRQIVGAVAIVLIIIGLFTVLSWVVGVLRSALDDTERRQSYADRLYGLVMFDTMPFDDVSKVDQSEFLQAAIWGAVYQIQKRDNGLSDYERDSETGSIILPKLEVDTYLTNLLGPDYKITDGSFQTEEFNYTYDEEKQGYLVPVTSMVAMYTPEVEKISTQSGKTYVTVGYIPTINNSSSGEINLTAPTEPTKYMDYVFTPIIQDRMVMQSSLSFLLALKDFIQQNPDMPLKEIRMFWNRMDGRVSKRLSYQYGLLFKELGLKALDTVIPDMERYGRETSPEERILFRSTLFPPSGKLLKGSGLDTLAGEIECIIHPDRQKA